MSTHTGGYSLDISSSILWQQAAILGIGSFISLTACIKRFCIVKNWVCDRGPGRTGMPWGSGCDECYYFQSFLVRFLYIHQIMASMININKMANINIVIILSNGTNKIIIKAMRSSTVTMLEGFSILSEYPVPRKSIPLIETPFGHRIQIDADGLNLRRLRGVVI